MSCRFLEICPTPNWYWYSTHGQFVRTICLTAKHAKCVHYQDLMAQEVADSSEYARIKSYIEKHPFYRVCPWLKEKCTCQEKDDQ